MRYPIFLAAALAAPTLASAEVFETFDDTGDHYFDETGGSPVPGWDVLRLNPMQPMSFYGVEDNVPAFDGGFLYAEGAVIESEPRPVEGGAGYALMFDSRNGRDQIGYSVSLVFRDAGGAIVGMHGEVFDEGVPARGDEPMTGKTLLANAPEGAATAAVRVSVPGLGVGVFDNFALAESRVPEPEVVGGKEVPEFRRYGDWVSSDVGGTGYIMGVRISPADPRRMYAYTDVGGLHRSEDGGRTWHALHDALPATRASLYVQGLEVHPDDPDHLVAAVGYIYKEPLGLFVSTDAGESWTLAQRAQFSGDSSTRPFGQVLVRGPEPGLMVAASIVDGVFVSDDFGRTWRGVGQEGTYPHDIDVDRTDGERMWYSAKAFNDYSNEHVIAGAPGTDAEGRAKFEAGFFRTDDGGGTWRRLSDDAPLELIQSPADADTLIGIFDEAREVRRSVDGGETWSPLNEGIVYSPQTPPSSTSEHAYQILQVAGDDVILGSSKGTLYRLAGDRWEKVEREGITYRDGWWGATPEFPAYGTDWDSLFGSAASVDVNPDDPDHWVMTDWYSIWQSFDAGRTWEWTTEGIEETYVDDVTTDVLDPTLVHMGGADVGYFRSTDGAQHFSGRWARSIISNNTKQVDVTAADPARLYATGNAPPGGHWHNSHLYRSDDRGLTWQPLAMAGMPLDKTSYLHELPTLDDDVHRIHTILTRPDDADVLYAAVAGPVGEGGGGLWLSTDGGDSFEWQDVGLPEGEGYFRFEKWQGGKEVAVSGDGSMLLLSNPHGEDNPNRLMRLAPGSDAAEPVDLPAIGATKPNEVVADPHTPGRFYLSDPNAGTFRSDDGGATWARLPTPDETPGAFYVTVDPRTPGRLALGSRDGVALSTDAGDTWRALDKSLPDRFEWNLGTFAEGPDGTDRLVVGTGGSGVYYTEIED